MTQKIAVIDPYMVSPSLSDFNHLVDLIGTPLQYHLPQVMGHKTLEESPASAYIVLGSASHVFQKLSWHAPLADFLMKKLEQNVPVLGICFGHQLLCQKFGSDVGFYRPDEVKLTGFRTVDVTKDLFGIKAGTQLQLAISHRQIVTKLAPCLEEYGRDNDLNLSFDMVRHRELPFFGVQPHPERIPSFSEGDRPAEADKIQQRVRKDGDGLITSFLRHYKVIG